MQERKRASRTEALYHKWADKQAAAAAANSNSAPENVPEHQPVAAPETVSYGRSFIGGTLGTNMLSNSVLHLCPMYVFLLITYFMS